MKLFTLMVLICTALAVPIMAAHPPPVAGNDVLPNIDLGIVDAIVIKRSDAITEVPANLTSLEVNINSNLVSFDGSLNSPPQFSAISGNLDVVRAENTMEITRLEDPQMVASVTLEGVECMEVFRIKMPDSVVLTDSHVVGAVSEAFPLKFIQHVAHSVGSENLLA